MENYLTNTHSGWGQERGYLAVSYDSAFIPLAYGHYSPDCEIQVSKNTKQIGSIFRFSPYQQD